MFYDYLMLHVIFIHLFAIYCFLILGVLLCVFYNETFMSRQCLLSGVGRYCKIPPLNHQC